MADSIEKLAGNVTLILISRLVMLATPFVASLLVWLGSGYIATKFEAQTQQTGSLVMRVDRVETIARELQDRATAIETSSKLGRDDRLAFQSNTIGKLEKIDDTLIRLASDLSALKAVVLHDKAFP